VDACWRSPSMARNRMLKPFGPPATTWSTRSIVEVLELREVAQLSHAGILC
jgi:hypothetical protein